MDVSGLMTNAVSKDITTGDSPYHDAFILPASMGKFLTNNLIYYLFSDQDVAVYSDLYSYNIEANLLLPYDALGDEYMTLSFNDGSDVVQCRVIGHAGAIDVWMFEKTGAKTLTRDVQDNTFSLTGDDITGTVFKSRTGKPFAVFCAANRNATYAASLNQLPPVNTWGTIYITPIVGTLNGTNTFKTKLKIVTNADNTVVSIDGDFNSIHVLQTRGDAIEVPIDPSVSYEITSSHQVLVGMLLFNSLNLNGTAFKILPAADNFAESPTLISHSIIPNTNSSFNGVTVTDGSGDHVTSYVPDIADGYYYFHVANDTKALSVAFMLILTSVKLITSTQLYSDLTQVGARRTSCSV